MRRSPRSPADYLKGLCKGDQTTLNAGDTAMTQSDSYMRQAVKQGEALYARLGGHKAFGNRVDFQAMYDAAQQAKQTAKP
jgi:hypothetical protein